MAIYSGFTHWKWWFSIVFCMFTRGYPKIAASIIGKSMNNHDKPLDLDLGMCALPGREWIRHVVVKPHFGRQDGICWSNSATFTKYYPPVIWQFAMENDPSSPMIYLLKMVILQFANCDKLPQAKAPKSKWIRYPPNIPILDGAIIILFGNQTWQ